MKKNKPITMIMYTGTDKLEAGLTYEMLMEKKESKKIMVMNTPTTKLELTIKDVKKMETPDFKGDRIIYKVECKVVAL